MRLWTLHPKYLDSEGLMAVWRDALRARRLLKEETDGDSDHPQLTRFRETDHPADAIECYLQTVFEEARERDVSFDASKLHTPVRNVRIEETEDRLLYEWHRLLDKLRERQPPLFRKIKDLERPDAHPMFTIIEDDVHE